MFKFLVNPQMLLTCILCGLHYGNLQSWACDIPLLFIGANYSGTFGAYMTFGHLTTNAIGATLLSFVQQKFPMREKQLLFFLVIINLIFCAFFVPTFGVGKATGTTYEEGDDPDTASDTFNVPWRIPEKLLGALVVIHGLFAGACLPAYLVAGAELGYPVSDGVSGGIVTLFVFIAMFIVPLLYAWIGIGYVNVLTLVLVVLLFILLFFLKIDYKRTAAETAGKEADSLNLTPKGVEMSELSDEESNDAK